MTRTVEWYREHRQAFERDVADWHEREQTREDVRIDREPEVDPDFEAWLEPDEDKT